MRIKTVNIGKSKICPDCGIEKLLSEYFTSKANRNSVWYSKRCKPCHNAFCREYRQTEKHKEVHKLWSRSDKGKKVRKNSRARWLQKYKENRIAHSAVSNAIRDGRLERQPCQICENTGEAHHENHSRPFDIKWLCKTHHAEFHYSP